MEVKKTKTFCVIKNEDKYSLNSEYLGRLVYKQVLQIKFANVVSSILTGGYRKIFHLQIDSEQD